MEGSSQKNYDPYVIYVTKSTAFLIMAGASSSLFMSAGVSLSK